MKVIIRAYDRHGEGQTTCCMCALLGKGTGSRCWDSMMSTVIVNDHRVGNMCGQCLKGLIFCHKLYNNDVVVENIKGGD